MQNQNRSGFFVPPHPDVPEETHHRVVTLLTNEYQARAKRLIKRSQRVGAISAEYRKQVEDLMGKGKYEQLRQYMADAMAHQSRRLAPPKGLDLSREDIEGLAASRREEGDAFLRKLGTKPEALSALNHRFQTKMQKAARLPDERKENQGKAVDVKDVPARIRKYKTNPWTIRSAPFDGYNWFLWLTESSDSLGYDWQLEQADYTDPEAGAVGDKFTINSSFTRTDGDTLTANTQAYSSVGFWYQMDSAQANEADRRGGLVEVWVEAQAAATQHTINLDREWPWADAWVDQNNYITLRATGEGDGEGSMLDIESRALVSRMVEVGANSVNWNTSWFDRGATVWTHHFSANVFPVDKWIWIQIGTETVNDVSTRDVGILSKMDFKWFIKSVQIRSSGESD